MLDRTFMFLTFYCYQDLYDQIQYLLPVSIVAVQAEDVRAILLFVCDLNGHHQEWVGSKTTNRHGVAAFDFGILSLCDQLIVGLTHASGGTPELLMTDIPELVQVTVLAQHHN